MKVKIEITDDNDQPHAWGLVIEDNDPYEKCLKLYEFLERIAGTEFGNAIAGTTIGSGRNLARGCFEEGVTQLK